MEMDDFTEGPVGVAVAASAVVFSPQVRRVLRRGLVYGVAGVLTAGEAVTGFVRGVRRSAGREAGNGAGGLEEGEREPRLPRGGRARAARRRSARSSAGAAS